MLVRSEYPSYIKYMGSKSKIMDFVIEGLNSVRCGKGPLLDLFAGSASLAGAVGRQVDFYSNDIQNYSRVLSQAYTASWASPDSPTVTTIQRQAEAIVKKNSSDIAGYTGNYHKTLILNEFNKLEERQRQLIGVDFSRDWHLFLKYYSGTWWTAEQCLWIDAYRQVAERYRDDSVYEVILASLMFAMAYSSQGTGHYAQYRDAKTDSSMKDILIYRQRDVSVYFQKKYSAVLDSLPKVKSSTIATSFSLDYLDCLEQFKGGTIYADPPYCFVHYSRFYHAIETLVLYDYPEIQVKAGAIVKGRYRVERHQSPFSIKSKVADAFKSLFEGVSDSGSKLVLSYSNTGMIELDELTSIANDVLAKRKRELLTMDHQHMTLGRQGIRHRDVTECLLLVY